jgi:hypothetical protein
MATLDTDAIRAQATKRLGRLSDGPLTFGVLHEGMVVDEGGKPHRLARSEPCLFLGPPARSKLLIAAAILDPSDLAPDPVRAFVTVPIGSFGGVWPSGLEDAVSRFPAAVERERPELLALVAGTAVHPLGEKTTRLTRPFPAVLVGRERGARGRRAIVLVRGTKRLSPGYLDAE